MNCVDCKTAIDREPQSERCWSCVKKRERFLNQEYQRLNPVGYRNRARAVAAVSLAIRTGALAPIAGQSCADCGRQAQVYEHRDYLLPLVVQPTCRSCNARRGKAMNSGFRKAA